MTTHTPAVTGIPAASRVKTGVIAGGLVLSIGLLPSAIGAVLFAMTGIL